MNDCKGTPNRLNGKINTTYFIGLGANTSFIIRKTQTKKRELIITDSPSLCYNEALICKISFIYTH